MGEFRPHAPVYLISWTVIQKTVVFSLGKCAMIPVLVKLEFVKLLLQVEAPPIVSVMVPIPHQQDVALFGDPVALVPLVLKYFTTLYSRFIMKYFLSISGLLLAASVCLAQTSYIPNHKTEHFNNSNSKTLSSLLTPTISDDYITSLKGNVRVVWKHVNPVLKGITFPSLYSARDGGVYMQGFSGNGGTFSKIDENGIILWMIDRYDHKDPAIKYFTSFEQCSELQDGSIQIYGGEGTSSGFVSGYIPKKMIISPTGIILEEKSTRSMISTLGSSGVSIPTFTNIIPDEILFSLGIEFYDVDDKSALKLYSMDTELTQRKKVLKIETGMTEFEGVSGVLPFKDGTFLVALEGKSVEQPMFHIAFFQYGGDFSFMKKTIIPTNGNSKLVIGDNNSIVIASSITSSTSKPLHLRKLDQNGSQLWEKVVDGLKDIPIQVNKLFTAKDGGFIVTGETWSRKTDGAVDYENEARAGIITKLSPDGDLLWYYTTGRAKLWNRIIGVAEATNGDIITVCNSGRTMSTFDYDESMEIVRLRPTTSSLMDEMSLDQNILTLAPNPAHTNITISCPGNISTVRLYNSLGMNIEVAPPQANESGLQQFDVSGLANGLYTVQVFSSNGVMHKPLVISR